MTKNNIDIKKVMSGDWKIFSSAFDGKFNKTTQFLLAATEITLSPLMVGSFQNAFLDDQEHDHDYVRPLFLLFKMGSKKDWDRMYSDIIKSSNYLCDYNAGHEDGSDLVMFVFSIPDRYKDDYLNFKRGRYSKFSNDYKSKFTKYISSKTKGKEESIIWQVIHKTDSLKRRLENDFRLPENFMDDQEEIWDEPRKEREIYNYCIKS